jgi:spore coat polysaccharide biosynthesis protein SpsF
MSLNIIVQVRMGSTRLPGKALLPLAGKALFAHVLEALCAVKGADRVIAAMPANSEEALGPIAAEYGCAVVLGSEDDVLGRFCQASLAFPSDYVMRATADNPLVCPELAAALIQEHKAAGADLSHYLAIPPGTGVELINTEALLRAGELATDPCEREHVTPYLYARRDEYTVYEPVKEGVPDLRLTVDTAEDYQRCSKIFDALYAGKPLPLSRILALFIRKPELFL